MKWSYHTKQSMRLCFELFSSLDILLILVFVIMKWSFWELEAEQSARFTLSRLNSSWIELKIQLFCTI